MTKNYPSDYIGQQGPPPDYATYDQYSSQPRYPPQPTYDSAPIPTYEDAPGPSYGPSYGSAPQPSYEGLQNSTYEAGSSTYTSTSTAYEPAENTYEAPNNTYEAQDSRQGPFEAAAGESSSYYQQSEERYAPPQAPQDANGEPVPHNPNEADRGLMGALAGGAAGAYGGHKIGHGILGALGGAYAGHKLEDAVKDKHKADKRRKEEMQQQQQWQQQQQQQNYGPPPAYSYGQQQPTTLGNFTGSSRDISLNARHHSSCKLTAHCRAISGHHRSSSVDLNAVIGNADGRFIWVGKGGNFTQTAQNVRLIQGGRVLEAELKNVRGEWCWSRIDLDERIGNHDGALVYIQ